MLRGIQASIRAMGVEQKRSDTIANNVANVNTDGFKRQTVTTTEFGSMLIQNEQAQTLGPLTNGPRLGQILTPAADGPISETGNPFDVAISGPGQFVYQMPDGQLGTTRSGAFHIDMTGQLVTNNGYPVLVNGLPVGGPGQQVAISDDGQVSVDGSPMGRLDLVGGTADTKMVPKSLEHSNVDLTTEMTDLIVALRSYQINQRALSIQDETLGKAVSDLAKV
ncbi:MAG: flagellar hook-basal body protein [Mycobacterium leprae]